MWAYVTWNLTIHLCYFNFSDCRVTQPSKAALNETTQSDLWTKSEDIIGSIEFVAPKELEKNLSETSNIPEQGK